jgi:cytochrome c oxidase assembly factor 2
MPPPLHPRSRFTSSLFATTLFASFFVVALPHVLPCPAPRVAYADDQVDGRTRRRRRRRKYVEDGGKEEVVVEESSDEEDALRRGKRECPVPKPGGVMGEILEFANGKGGGKPP